VGGPLPCQGSRAAKAFAISPHLIPLRNQIVGRHVFPGRSPEVTDTEMAPLLFARTHPSPTRPGFGLRGRSRREQVNIAIRSTAPSPSRFPLQEVSTRFSSFRVILEQLLDQEHQMAKGCVFRDAGA